jgi:hypothetical protein
MHEHVIDLNETVSETHVRVVLVGGQYRVCRLDLMVAMCEGITKQAEEIWRKYLSEEEKELILSEAVSHQLHGEAHPLDMLTLHGCALVVMMIPGKHARHIRAGVLLQIQRWVNARAVHVAPAVEKQEHISVQERALSLRERELKHRIEASVFDHTVRHRRSDAVMQSVTGLVTVQERLMGIYQELCGTEILDERGRALFKEMLLKVSEFFLH